MTARATVTATEEREGRRVAVCATELLDQDGGRIAEGSLEALVGA
jgi:acyl-coenzyme A thioesterase PaaI-like protein